MFKSCLVISKGIKATICKINNVSIVTSNCPKYYCTKLTFGKITTTWKIFEINDKILKSKISVQQKKFCKLLQESKTENDPEKVIFNFSKYVLSDIEKKLLAKDLNFCLPPKQLKYAEYLVHFELFYRDIRNLEILSNFQCNF